MTQIYPLNIEQKIGFDRVRTLIKERCSGKIAKEIADEFKFSSRIKKITREIGETTELITIIENEEHFPLDITSDIRSYLKRAKIQGTFLETEELFDIKGSLETTKQIVLFFKAREEDLPYPNLSNLIRGMDSFPELYNKLDRILTKHGKIKDNASRDLSNIRREIQGKTSGVSRTINSILKRLQSEGTVDKESAVSIRDGRVVIPVPSAFKRRIKGIVHDESATGKTSYIEPAEIVEVNNEIRELEYSERREIVKILTEVTDEIRPHTQSLYEMTLLIGELDFIRAKANISRLFDSSCPNISDAPELNYIDARHPILEQNLKQEKKSIVPIDMTLNKESRIVLISGPNAGGKSVCLKTTALLQYMLQCGLPIPVDSDSKAGIFEDIFIDIGDEQSLDNDLSTYSSHLLNMKFFVKNCTKRSLILIDEFGTGTEPMLGGAIAESVLKELNEIECFGVITTHYTNLKHFAESSSGIENGAMLYDSHKMEPLFKLSIGKPGSSFAFEIARKIGLPEHILAAATEKIGADHINFDKHLREITRDKRYWEEKRRQIRKTEKRLEELTASYEEDLEQTAKRRKEIVKQAEIEAEKIISGSNKIVEQTIREIKESQAEKGRTKIARNKLSQFKESITTDIKNENAQIDNKIETLKERERRRQERRGKRSNNSQVKLNKKETPKKEIPITVGSIVLVKGTENRGEVITIKGDNITVAFGHISSIIKSKRLEVISSGKQKKAARAANSLSLAKINRTISEKKLNFRPEIDIRGERVEDALPKIINFIDNAVVTGATEVRVLHGKGSGILRQVVREHLNIEPAVSSCQDEHIENGGSGITVVYLN